MAISNIFGRHSFFVHIDLLTVFFHISNQIRPKFHEHRILSEKKNSFHRNSIHSGTRNDTTFYGKSFRSLSSLRWVVDVLSHFYAPYFLMHTTDLHWTFFRLSLNLWKKGFWLVRIKCFFTLCCCCLCVANFFEQRFFVPSLELTIFSSSFWLTLVVVEILTHFFSSHEKLGHYFSLCNTAIELSRLLTQYFTSVHKVQTVADTANYYIFEDSVFLCSLLCYFFCHCKKCSMPFYKLNLSFSCCSKPR